MSKNKNTGDATKGGIAISPEQLAELEAAIAAKKAELDGLEVVVAAAKEEAEELELAIQAKKTALKALETEPVEKQPLAVDDVAMEFTCKAFRHKGQEYKVSDVEKAYAEQEEWAVKLVSELVERKSGLISIVEQ